jgi:hypothetical protein
VLYARLILNILTEVTVDSPFMVKDAVVAMYDESSPSTVTVLAPVPAAASAVLLLTAVSVAAAEGHVNTPPAVHTSSVPESISSL